MKNDKVRYLIDMINDMDIKDYTKKYKYDILINKGGRLNETKKDDINYAGNCNNIIFEFFKIICNCTASSI